MTDITLVKFAGQLVIDSRIIAEQLGIKHKTFMENIRSRKATIEANFGILPFQTAEIDGRGQPETFVYLNEAQSTFVMTLSRNTPEVIRCKVGLVKAFQEQKRKLEDPADRALLDGLASRISEIDSDPWSLTNEQAGQAIGMMFGGEGDVAPTQPCKPDQKIIHGIKYVLCGDNLTPLQRSVLEDLLL